MYQNNLKLKIINPIKYLINKISRLSTKKNQIALTTNQISNHSREKMEKTVWK